MPDGIRQFATPLTGQKKNNLQEKGSYNRIYQYGIKQEGTYIIMDSKVKDMTSGSPGKLILTFAIPLMFGNVFQQFYTMVDTMVVGQSRTSCGRGSWGRGKRRPRRSGPRG